VVCQWVDAVRREAQRTLARRYQVGRRTRIAGGVECDRVPKMNEFLGQVVNDAFGSAVGLGWNALVQWRYLCNLHKPLFGAPRSRLPVPWFVVPFDWSGSLC